MTKQSTPRRAARLQVQQAARRAALIAQVRRVTMQRRRARMLTRRAA